MRLLILLFFSSFFYTAIQAQIGTGTWRLHVATGRAIDVASSDTYIYTAYENGLMRYDFTSKEKRLYTAINGISDIEISTLFYDSLQEALYIGYVNGNIDKLINDEVINIPSVKLAQIPGSKKINRFYRDITYIYVATDFSVLQLDTDKDEIKETLLFAESYAKGELDLELEYIYVIRIPSYTYYKSVDVLPDNKEVDSVTFAFRKID